MASQTYRIAVYGSHSGELDERASVAAQTLGQELAKRGHVLLTGGGKGLPHKVAKVAAAEGGKVIAYSFARSPEEHAESGLPTEGFSEIRYVPANYELGDNVEARRLYRNITTVNQADAVICISGRWGTLNEAANAEHMAKPIGVVIGTGGTADELPALMRRLKSARGAFFIAAEDPVYVLDALEGHLDPTQN